MASKTRASSLLFLPTTLPLVLLLTSTTLTIHTQSQTQDSDSDYDYNACKPFVCGNINFTFPFASSETFGYGTFDCGLPRFKISCDASIPSLELYGHRYQVKSLFSSQRLVTVVEDKLINNLTLSSSCKSLHNLTNPTAAKDTAGARLSLASFGANLTVFVCPDGLSLSSRSLDGVFGNFSCSEGYKVYFWDLVQGVSPVVPVEVPSGCTYVNLPVLAGSRNRKAFLDTPNVTGLAYWLGDGFPLQWPDFEECTGCNNTGGRCGYDGSSGKIVCFCKGLQPNLHARGGCL